MKYYYSFKLLLNTLKKDFILLIVIFLPIILGIAIKFIVPILNDLISNYLDTTNILIDYFIYFDLMLVIITPYMLCYCISLIILEERDEGILNYYSVTPMNTNAFLISRYIITVLIAYIYSFILFSLFHISDISYIFVLLFSIACCISSICLCCFILSLSTNKLEGLMLGKLSSIFLLAIFMPIFDIKTFPYFQYIVPYYWLGLYISNFEGYYILISIVNSTIIIFVLKKYLKLHK